MIETKRDRLAERLFVAGLAMLLAVVVPLAAYVVASFIATIAAKVGVYGAALAVWLLVAVALMVGGAVFVAPPAYSYGRQPIPSRPRRGYSPPPVERVAKPAPQPRAPEVLR